MSISSFFSSMATPSLATVGHTITEKVSRENFLVWKAQVLPHVRAAGLMGYLDGSMAAHPSGLTTETEESGTKVSKEAPQSCLYFVVHAEPATPLLLAGVPLSGGSSPVS